MIQKSKVWLYLPSIQNINCRADHNLRIFNSKQRNFEIEASKELYLWNSLQFSMLTTSLGLLFPIHVGSSKKPFYKRLSQNCQKLRILQRCKLLWWYCRLDQKDGWYSVDVRKPWSFGERLQILKGHNRDVPCTKTIKDDDWNTIYDMWYITQNNHINQNSV